MPPPKLKPENVRYIAIHCSASAPSVKVNASVINRWHREKGWLGIGYHFVITRGGVVEAGRPLDQVGAHVGGFNAVSVGICLAGGVDSKGKPEDNFTPEQYAALAELILTLREKFPQAVVLGHREFPNVAKACPSFDVQRWLKETVDVQ
jgi:N-acetylmuramoyl-L-alanine amidase